jgi:hypothetical protein
MKRPLDRQSKVRKFIDEEKIPKSITLTDDKIGADAGYGGHFMASAAASRSIMEDLKISAAHISGAVDREL